MNWRAIVALIIAITALYILAGLASAEPLEDMGRPAAQVVTEPFVYASGDDCKITVELKVRGIDTSKCVEYLDTAARLAKSELTVNKQRKRKR